jgi:hypothetical protein
MDLSLVELSEVAVKAPPDSKQSVIREIKYLDGMRAECLVNMSSILMRSDRYPPVEIRETRPYLQRPSFRRTSSE